jgi:hypothetical protein
LTNGFAAGDNNPSPDSIEMLTRRLVEVETEKASLADQLAKLEKQGNKEALVQGT